MQRKTFKVVLSGPLGDTISEDIAYAHNSSVRKSEALVRSYARSHGVIMHGSKPVRDEEGYSRVWRSSDSTHEVVASTFEV